MKRGLFSLFLLVSVVFAPAARAEVIDRIAAVVGKEIVLLSELQEVLESLRPAVEDRAGQLPISKAEKQEWVDKQLMGQAPRVLEELIRDRLVLAQAKKFHLEISESDLDKTIARVASQQGLDQESFRRLVAEQGYSWESYREELRRAMLRGEIQQQVLANRVQITESDQRAYYNQHYGLGGKEEVHLRLLFLEGGDSAATRKLAEKKAKQLLARVRAGEDFGRLAQENTQGPNAAQGGDVGFLGQGEMFPAIEKAAFALDQGQASDVIATEKGFFLLQVLEKRGGEALPFEEVQDEVRERLRSERIGEVFDAWLEELERETPIERRL